MLAWLTIDAPGDDTCLGLRVPTNFVKHVMGALGELTYPENWEQDGTLTPEECAQYMSIMWGSAGVGCMIAEVKMFASDSVPSGFLLCDGTEYERTAYPALYDAIGAAYIVDSDHFKVPDMLDVFPRGSDVPGEVGGSDTAEISVDNLPAHHHAYHDWGSVVTNSYLGEVPALVPSESTQDTQDTGAGEPLSIVPTHHTFVFGIRY